MKIKIYIFTFIFIFLFSKNISQVFASFSTETISTSNITSTLEKKDFASTDIPKFQISNKKNNGLITLFKNIFLKNSSDLNKNTTIIIKNPKGDIVNSKFINLTIDENKELQVEIDKEILIPGQYEIEIIDNQSQEEIHHNFSWGVLTINPNKSLYKTNDMATFAIAVLDETGDMVCDAKIELQIYTPDDKTITLSTENSLIKSNSQCYSKQVSLIPDYESQHLLNIAGNYKIKLTANTTNGQHIIEDSFSVEDNPLFNIERLAATRIYPLQKYPITNNIKFSNDFTGYIIDSVPIDFQIISDVELKTEIKNNRKYIYWPVRALANQEINLNYYYDAPDISPEIFSLGPIQITTLENQVVYQESRLWQIASDNIFSSVTFTNVGSTNWTIPTNVYSITIEAWGAGGGGGDGTNNGGGGGGGGAYAATTISVTPGTLYNIVVGTGGASATTTGGSGTKGGDTSFNGTTVLAIGGNGGGPTTGGAGGLASSSIGATKFNGGIGGNGNTTSDGGGGGGGAAGPSGIGISGGNANTTIGGYGGNGNNNNGGVGGIPVNGTNGGNGGIDALGGGGGAGGDNNRYGGNGGSIGAGGGGGETQSTTLSGAGANGKVYISYYINEVPGLPLNSVPTNGASNQSQNPTLTSTAFSDPDISDTHANSQWQISTNTTFTAIVWDSNTTPTNLTSVTVNSSNGTFQGALSGQTLLAPGTLYYWRVRHQDNRNNWSSYSTYSSFTTYTPPPPNQNLKFDGLKINGLSFR